MSVPLNTYIANILKKMQIQQMKSRDRRTKLMSELLNNIKSIKLYAWDYAVSLFTDGLIINKLTLLVHGTCFECQERRGVEESEID